jgi:hypothetical protein
MIKENIVLKKKVLEYQIKEIQVEKIEEKNAQIIISNIRRNTFSLVLEYNIPNNQKDDAFLAF